MPFLLSTTTVLEYLNCHNLVQTNLKANQIEQKVARNFNLLVSLLDGRTLLIKQACYRPDGEMTGGFVNESRIQEFLQQFPSLNYLRSCVPEVIHFDVENSIIVFNYLKNYRDLIDFYTKEKIYPTSIAAAIGSTVAAFHRVTLDRPTYRDFFCQQSENGPVNGGIPQIIRKFDRISPEVFGQVPSDGLKFFALYQRYESLRTAIIELTDTIEPCCLTHNDLKLNNLLLHDDWEHVLSGATTSEERAIRLIDWERCSWGDPAFDVGMLIGSYLLLWLKSLVVSKSMDIEESLRMAVIPLEQLQPSIAALVKAYFNDFPEILESCPQFVKRVMQFSGLALILHIQATLQHRKTFGNTGICMLQVAKGLLCYPERFISTVFGTAASEITTFQPVFA